MPIFKLTAEQEAIMFAEIHKAEDTKYNGAVFGQIYYSRKGDAMCRAHHIDQDRAEQIKEIIGE